MIEWKTIHEDSRYREFRGIIGDKTILHLECQKNKDGGWSIFIISRKISNFKMISWNNRWNKDKVLVYVWEKAHENGEIRDLIFDRIFGGIQ